jgi:NADH:ubiquinone reductase (non-electrogenic)
VFYTAATGDGLPGDPYHLKIAYDMLMIASGAEPLTFKCSTSTPRRATSSSARSAMQALEIRRKLLSKLVRSDSENPDSHTRSSSHTVAEGKCIMLIMSSASVGHRILWF